MLTIDDKKLLLSIVAALEALHTPYRHGQAVDRVAAAIGERRAAYWRGYGLAWKVGGDAADRLAGTRALRRLASAGFIQLHRHTRSDQRCGVSLANVGAALSLCPIKTLRQAWPLLERVAALSVDPEAVRMGGAVDGYVNEHSVCQIPLDSTDGTRAEKFASDAAGLLIAGYLATQSDTVGAIGWHVTPRGHAALKAGRPKRDAKALAQYDPALSDEYFALLDSALAERLSWTADSNVVAIPFSAGRWSSAAATA